MKTHATSRAPKTYNSRIASLSIRLGLAFVFAYAAIDAFREPAAWLSFIPSFTDKFIAVNRVLDMVSIVQLLLVVWLLSGKYLKYAAGVTIALLAGIMVFNTATILITFRDIGLIAAAVGLIFLDAEN